jgi:hypothetical protein
LSSTTHIEAATTLLNDTTIVFNKENDISRQVDKPIYVEGQDNDGQTQRTGQTMVPCTAVRAEHTVIAPVEDNFERSFTTSLIPYDLHTCFNKFLLYYHLPLLPHGQTIQTLLQHIDKYNNNKTVSSITFSVNSSYNETHIYLPNDTLLPDHIVIVPYLLPLFYNLPLRSNSFNPTSTPSDLFFDNYSSTVNYNSSLPLSNPTPHHLNLTIATHNVRGFNEPTKREAWQDYCLNHNISIASITETKISDKTNLFFCNNNFFTYYWSNSPTSIEGTAIMIRNNLKPHIHSIHTHPGGAIALDIFFRSNIKLRIISVYLSSTDMTTRNQTQNTVINWIQQAAQLHIHPIILGDFNTQDNIHSSSSKYKLINFLNNTNMYDIGAHLNNKHSTWSNNTSSSRIDYI